MRKFIALTTLLALCLNTFAGDTLENFQNNREGISQYYDSKEFAEFLEKTGVDPESFKEEFLGKASVYRPPRACAWDLLYHYKYLIGDEIFEQNSNQALYLLRHLNLIDDVVFKFVAEAEKARQDMLTFREYRRYPRNMTRQQLDRIEREVSRWKSNVQSPTPCRSSSSTSLYNGLLRSAQDQDDGDVYKIINWLFKEGKLNDQEYNEVISFYRAGLGEWKTSLQKYLVKRKYVQRNAPVTGVGYSDFVTERVKKLDGSLRQRLYERFSETQIDLMANIVKKLATRLNVDRGEVNLFIEDELVETIPLAPMEIYRMTIRLLRKEMLELNNSSLFQGNQFSYQDVITAAFEAGYVNGAEIEEIQRLEELWNPKKSIFQKLRFWIQTTVSVGTVLVPPPWNFLGVLALIVIDTYTTTGDDTFGHQYSLF